MKKAIAVMLEIVIFAKSNLVFGIAMSNEPKDNDVKGYFAASILLSEVQWDPDKFLKDLLSDWNIDFSSDDNDKEAIVAHYGDGFAAVALMPGRVPDDEAEHYAAANYMWPGAVDAAKAHKAHILVAITGGDDDIMAKAKLFTKIVATCLKQDNAIAVYTDGVVFQPEFYKTVAAMLHEDGLPVLNWVWFGPYHADGHTGIYTYGLRKFGKEEIEVYADADLNEVRDFLFDIVAYVLECDVVLNDGETIGFSEEQKLQITVSPGIALPGDTIKIEYPS